MSDPKKSKIWRHSEQHASHALVRLYTEAHGQGDYLGEFTDDEVKALILSIKPDVDVEKESHRLHYFGFLPLLVIASTKSIRDSEV